MNKTQISKLSGAVFGFAAATTVSSLFVAIPVKPDLVSKTIVHLGAVGLGTTAGFAVDKTMTEQTENFLTQIGM